MNDLKIEVLIIEDEQKIAKIHSRFLEKIDNFVLTGVANCIEDAKFMIKELKPDLILLDVYFPDGNGIDLLYTLRSNHTDVDVILITAADDVENLNKALKGGIFDYIIKPVFFERFQESLEKYKDRFMKLSSKRRVSQDTVDYIFSYNEKDRIKYDNTPKGIEPITLDQVVKIIEKQNTPLTAAETGKLAGISRTTARKYLEYLYSVNIVEIELEYGTIGRPERRYRKNVKSSSE